MNLLPDSADVVAGQEIRMQAEVVDFLGMPIEQLLPEWESADTSTATVDATGVVRGRAEGMVEIRASIPDAEDVSRVRVLPHPRIVVSEPAVHWGIGAGGPRPPNRALSISNGGAGTLGTLELDVRHVPESLPWLVAELASPTAPSTIELSAHTDELGAGTYEAVVIVTSDSTGVEPIEVPVSLTLTDFSLAETGEATAVSESSGTDTVLVALDSAPSATVVLSVSLTGASASASPLRLSFAPDDWSTPRVITVSGVDDDAVGGDSVSELRVAVDAAASDSAFHGIPAKVLQVTTVDDDEAGLLVEESSGETVVTEGGVTDDLVVSLTARPRSDVLLGITSGDPSEVAATPGVLRFTPGDWQSPQVVTVQGVADGITDGPTTSTVTLSIDRAASDGAFDAVPDVSVAVTALDVDTVGVSEGSPTGHPGVSSAGLVAAYNLTTLTGQGLLRDFGSGLHGSISGTSVVAAPRGGARLFQVATDRIELPARSHLDLDGPLTVVARFRLDVASRHQHVLACDDKFALAVREADQVRLSNTRGDFAETLSPLSTVDWHTVIGVFRGTAGDALGDTNIEIWIDGVRAPIRTLSSNGAVPPVWRDGVLHPTDACYIGFESHQGDPSHQNLAFHGAVDEILVFGRALTEQEVQLLSGYP